MMDIQCQLMLQPLALEKYNAFIDECYEVLNGFPVSYSIATMNVLIHGQEKEVFRAVEGLFSFARTKHPTILLYAIYSTAFDYKAG